MLISFYVLFLIVIKIKSLIKIPFEKKIESNLITPEYLCKNKIKSNIIIGSLNEKIEITFDLSSQKIYIPDSSFEKINYDIKKSSSYKLISEVKNCELDDVKFNCFESLENLIFENEKNNKEKISELSFILLQKNKTEISNGIIGLKSKSNENSFINQLKKKNYIQNYTFIISYENDFKGEIIFGNYPHIYNKKYYKEEDFFFIPIQSYSSWKIMFDSISYINGKVDNYENAIVNFNFGGILGSLLYQKYLNQSFFKDYFLNKSCSINYFIYYEDYDYELKYSQIICDKNINISNFPPLNFTKKQYNITINFTYQDLFRIYNDKYYLMVFFEVDRIFEWILGEPFFWKFETVFDVDKSIIGFYKKIKKDKDYKFVYIIIIIILSFLVIILSILLFINISKKPRKKRANELEDNDYDYIQQSNFKIN